MGNQPGAPRRPPLDAEAQVLASMQTQLLTPFSDDDHEGLLRRLWAAAYPGAPFERRSQRWKELGFQSPDPGTDVRGGGELCLRQLIYLFETHRDEAEGVLARRRERRISAAEGTMPNYPFAAAGINLTRTLGQLFCLLTPAGAAMPFTDHELPYWQLALTEARFHELFCWSVLMLDQLWDEQGADYLRFNEMLKLLRSRMEAVLTAEPDALIHSGFSLHVGGRATPPAASYLELQRSSSGGGGPSGGPAGSGGSSSGAGPAGGGGAPLPATQQPTADLLGLDDPPPPQPPMTRRQLSDEGLKLFLSAVGAPEAGVPRRRR